MTRWAFGGAALCGLFLACSALAVGAQEAIDPDRKAVAVINALIDALEIEDEAARTAALVQVFHPVLLTEDGTDVVRNMKGMIDRRIENFRGFVTPVDFEKVERVGGGHRFGSLAVESVDRYYARKGDGGSSMIPIVWTDAGEAKVIALPR